MTQCASCRSVGPEAKCDTCPRTPWEGYATSEAGLREYVQAELTAAKSRIGDLEQERDRLREENETDDTNVRQVAREIREQDETTILNLRNELSTAWLERNELLKRYQDRTTEKIELQAQLQAVQDALCMLYDKYEDGDPCTENGDEHGSYMGNCVRLSADEEDQILRLIPAERGKL